MSLPDDISAQPAGEMFTADLEEAEEMAKHDARFEQLVEGLRAESVGKRLAAIDAFFAQFSPPELASLELPPNLSQLRFIHLSSRPAGS